MAWMERERVRARVLIGTLNERHPRLMTDVIEP
jgi:hypothetical protein